MRRAGVVLLVLSVACVSSPLKMQLRFTPESHLFQTPIFPSNPVFATVPIAVGLISDGRKMDDPTLIGENRETENRRIPVQSLSPVMGFVELALKFCLAGWGVKVSADAERVLRGEVLEFFVSETGRYTAKVRFRFRLEDRGGRLLWQGEVAGDDSTWGRSLSQDNYNQVLSTAMKRAFADLLDRDDFRVAVKEPG